jgi:hypothetical protein
MAKLSLSPLLLLPKKQKKSKGGKWRLVLTPSLVYYETHPNRKNRKTNPH